MKGMLRKKILSFYISNPLIHHIGLFGSNVRSSSGSDGG